MTLASNARDSNNSRNWKSNSRLVETESMLTRRSRRRSLRPRREKNKRLSDRRKKASES